MMRRHANRFAALAIIALAAAVTASSYAAIVPALPAASVGSTQLKGGAVTAAKIAVGAVTTRAVRDRTLIEGDLAAAQTTGPAGHSGPAGQPGTAGNRGAAGPIGPTGVRGPAGAPGPKGPTGDRGSAPANSLRVVVTQGNVDVPANNEQTGTLACPAGMRVLSGSPSGLLTGPTPPRLTVVASEPNAAGTGWTVTMRAAALASNFQIEMICASVD